MTLVITALAALAVTVARFVRPDWGRRHRLGALALMYAGAALMWSVDGVAALVAGESFIELADAAVVADDSLLGLTVLALGLVVWAALLAVKGRALPAVA
jgi:hypothetical protein